MLNKTNQVGYTNTLPNAKPSLVFLSSSSIFRMPIQRIWQTAYIRIFSVQQIVIVRIYFHGHNRIRVGQTRVGGGFTVSHSTKTEPSYNDTAL
jgi:hypothetical protein